MDEDEIITTREATAKELTNEIISSIDDKDKSMVWFTWKQFTNLLDEPDYRFNMAKIRQSNFEYEKRKMSKITDMVINLYLSNFIFILQREKKGEFNFFSMFEASYRNLPRDTVKI